jgi:hypothetical protein
MTIIRNHQILKFLRILEEKTKKKKIQKINFKIAAKFNVAAETELGCFLN